MLTLHKLELTGETATVTLTAAEATLLKAFASAADARIDYPQVARYFGLIGEEEKRSGLQLRIVRLRKKLHQAGAQGVIIANVRNFGYQFFEPLSVVAP